MAENDRQARLDGNAAAGLLATVLRGEPSEMVLICAGCGDAAPMGALLAYGMEMGAVLRCAVCDTAVLRAGAGGAALWLDLRGAVAMRVAVEG